MDKAYIVEIEYRTKDEISVQAISKQWAQIIAEEQWKASHSQEIIGISVKEDDTNGF